LPHTLPPLPPHHTTALPCAQHTLALPGAPPRTHTTTRLPFPPRTSGVAGSNWFSRFATDAFRLHQNGHEQNTRRCLVLLPAPRRGRPAVQAERTARCACCDDLTLPAAPGGMLAHTCYFPARQGRVAALVSLCLAWAPVLQDSAGKPAAPAISLSPQHRSGAPTNRFRRWRLTGAALATPPVRLRAAPFPAARWAALLRRYQRRLPYTGGAIWFGQRGLYTVWYAGRMRRTFGRL